MLILGSGEAASVSERVLKILGIPVERAEGIPDQVIRTNGRYVALCSDENWGGQALILAPSDADEAERLLAAFGSEGLRPRIESDWGGLATHRPGVYLCDPELDPDLTGKAAAARVTAWLGRVSSQVPNAAIG